MLTDCMCSKIRRALEIIKKEAKIQKERNSLKEIKETTHTQRNRPKKKDID